MHNLDKKILGTKIATLIISFALFIPIVVVSAVDGTEMKSNPRIEQATALQSESITKEDLESTSEFVEETTTEKATEKVTTEITTELLTEESESDENYTEFETKKTVYEEIPTTVNTFYDEDDLYILSHLIYGEAGGESDECQLAVGSVVLNRVKSKSFPNSISGVVFAPGQYACTWDGNYDKEPDARAIKNARYLLENGSQLPDGVVFQAQFAQGEIYEIIDGEYFCYG